TKPTAAGKSGNPNPAPGYGAHPTDASTSSTPPAPTHSATTNSPRQSGGPRQVRRKDQRLSLPLRSCASRDGCGDSERIRSDGERWVERCRRREEAAVDDIQIADVVTATVGVENADGWVRAGDRSAAHVGVGGDAHTFAEHDRVAGLADRAADPLDQLLVRCEVVRRPVDHDPVAIDGNPVARWRRGC